MWRDMILWSAVLTLATTVGVWAIGFAKRLTRAQDLYSKHLPPYDGFEMPYSVTSRLLRQQVLAMRRGKRQERSIGL